MKKWLTTALAALSLILLALTACGGGFGGDDGPANELEPGIFKPDTTK